MSAQGYTEKEYMALQGIYTGKYNVLINVPLAVANGLASSVIPSLTAAVAKRDKGGLSEEESAESARNSLFWNYGPCGSAAG